MRTQFLLLFTFLTFFVPKVAFSFQVGLPSRSIPVPMFNQTTDYTCGPASSMSVLKYLGMSKGNSEMKLAEEMGTLTTTGTRFWNLAKIFEQKGLKAFVKIGTTIAELRAAVRLKQPVIINLDDEGGHYVVLAGFDKSNIFFMDPWYAYSSYRKWDLKKFEAHWYDSHDGVKYDRLGIFISK
jgi:predicted double-glycine peptidase